jgi:hypothetical protein
LIIDCTWKEKLGRESVRDMVSMLDRVFEHGHPEPLVIVMIGSHDDAEISDI